MTEEPKNGILTRLKESMRTKLLYIKLIYALLKIELNKH